MEPAKAETASRRKAELSAEVGALADGVDKIDYLMEKLLTAETATSSENAPANTEAPIQQPTQRESNGSTRDSEKAIALMRKKLDSTQKMLANAEVGKSKLEELCRGLQKALKEEKDQSIAKLKMMQRTHQESVDSFKKSLSDIQQSFDAKQEHNKKVVEVEKLSENLAQLAGDYDKKLRDLKQLYAEREVDILKVARAREKEIGDLQKEMLDMQTRVKEVFEENVKLKKELLHSEGRVKRAIESELELKKVVDNYSEKYNKLMKSLEQSDSAFDRIKAEMAKMNGNLIKVETDARKYKAKMDEANKVILKLTTERVEREEVAAKKDRQLAQLQELCRRLQAGRDSSSGEGREKTAGDGDVETSEISASETEETSSSQAPPAASPAIEVAEKELSNAPETSSHNVEEPVGNE